MSSFCTVVNCMDGRVQLPVIMYLQRRLNVEYVDTITEAGPNLIMASQADRTVVKSILRRVRISVEKHASVGIGLVGHHDCAGNPAKEEEQLQHLIDGVAFLRLHYGEIPVVGLWVDANWKVKEVVNSEQGAAADAATRRG
jgi:carbonic anhydrase